MALAGVALEGWNQFRLADIIFDRSCTVITGANGAGKSTALRLLAKHAGWDFHDLRLAEISPTTGETGIPPGHRKIGSISYDDNAPAILSQPAEAKRGDPLIHVARLHQVPCIFIPSVRPTPPVRRHHHQDAGPYSPGAALTRVSSALKLLNEGLPGENPMEAIANLGRASTLADTPNELRRFEEVLAALSPREIGLRGVRWQGEQPAIMTRAGEFHFFSLSGGLSSLVLISWLCAMFEAVNKHGTVLLDEPENHIHPGMQRRILPTLVSLFPSMQFIVATHSPMIVGSVRGCRNFVLQHTKSGVVSHDLATMEKGGTADDFLQGILGVTFSGPEWVEDALEAHYKWLKSQIITPSVLREFRDRMDRDGLDRFVPRTLLRAMRRRRS